MFCTLFFSSRCYNLARYILFWSIILECHYAAIYRNLVAFFLFSSACLYITCGFCLKHRDSIMIRVRVAIVSQHLRLFVHAFHAYVIND